MPAPKPQPGDHPSNSGTFGGITLTVPDGGSKTKASLYGLGDWGSQNVNPGDLPVFVNLAGGAKGTTGDAIVEAFAHGSADQIATIQHALLMAGTYYPANFQPKYGVVSQQDVAAFAEAVKTAGQAGAPVADLLAQQAKSGAAMGITAAQAAGATSKVATVTLPNTQDLEAVAIKAYQQVQGKKATPQEAARFAAFYRSMAAGVQRAQNQAQYDATNPQLSGALANADPNQLTNEATGLPVSPFMGPVGTQGAGGVDENGHVVAPMTGPVVPGQSRPYVNPVTGQVEQPSFTDKVGGLMSLGQAVGAAQAHGNPGLTQITQDSLPSADVAATNFARNADPKGAAATDTANVFDTFLSLLSKRFA